MGTDSPLCLEKHGSKQLVSGLFYPGPQLTTGWGSIMDSTGCSDSMAVRDGQAPWQECCFGVRQPHILTLSPLGKEQEAFLTP